MSPKTLLWPLALLLVLILAALAYLGRAPRPAEPPPVAATPPATQAALPAPEFVGRAACAGCHAEEDRLWQGSHHDLAMQEANEGTVLGNFADAEFRKDGVVSRFFRQGDRFMVRTDGPDGALADFQVKYTFGVTPLQQYLVELPGGRLQALSIAWDSRAKAQGGQRWFHLYPNEKIGPDDELHWTKLSQNWNYMCAECHSTDLRKNYDAATRSYETTWAEIDVSCEACHGPASRHVAWAQGGGRTGGGWTRTARVWYSGWTSGRAPAGPSIPPPATPAAVRRGPRPRKSRCAPAAIPGAASGSPTIPTASRC